MRGRFIYQAVLAILLICQFSVCLGTEAPDPNESTKYLNAVRAFADNVLKYGRDTYGPKHTPLFVDGLNIHTHEPVKWIAPNGDRWILSNLASQQNLFRTLDGLTKITGDPKYKQAAMDAIKYAFENLRSPNGLLYWGGHSAYDAGADRPCGRGVHEFKSHYPYYELMWQTDPNTTKRFIEAFWAGHILDWSNLDFDRHCYNMTRPLNKPWEYEYEGGPVFFESKRPGSGVSFLCTGSDLFRAAALLTKLSAEKESLVWGKRLAHRYIETRDPNTGIGAWIYTGKRERMSTLKQMKDYGLTGLTYSSCFPYSPTFGDPDRRRLGYGYCTVSPGIPFNLAVSPWICALLVGEMMDSDGKEFIQWSVEELTAIGKVAYRKIDNSWIPMLRDGTSLEGLVIRRGGSFGPEGTVAKPIRAIPMDFWAYALAYRLTGSGFLWQMARNIALGNGFGDIGATSDDTPELKDNTDCADPFALMGFLELYKKTGCKAFLDSAEQIGSNILATRFYKGFFVPSSKYVYTRFDSPESFALLHLHVANISSHFEIPTIWPSLSFFEDAYRNKDAIDDIGLIYTLMDSSNPPISLQEAAAVGNVELVRMLIEKGAKVDGREDSFFKTALHRATLSCRKAVVEFLLAKGAQVDARDSYICAPLHYAAEKGQKEVAELLIAGGADVDAKSAAGDTPLHSAVRAVHKDIVELLIANGADINVKNNDGQTPLDIAFSRNRSEVVNLLISKGADVSLHTVAQHGLLEKLKELIDKGASVNTKDNAGETALEVAIQEYRQDIVKLLIDKGAEVSINVAAFIGDVGKVKDFIEGGGSVDIADTSGQTPLHYAVAGNHKDIAEFLILHSAEVNAVAGTWKTPLGVAARTGSVDVAEYLIAHGADINGREGHWTPLQEAAYYSKEMVELLLAKGANINAGKWTALHSALDAERFDIVELLLANGADVNIKDDKGRTPLHIAAWYAAHDNPNIVTSLLSKGADLDAKDQSGRTALLYAIEDGHTGIVELLRKHGAKAGAVRNASDVVSEKPYVVLEYGDIRAVIINNEPVDDEVLPGHRGGYSGVASLTHRSQNKNLFVPLYAGLNFEHIHDGTVKPRDILFEPRQAPMETRRVGPYTAELYQPSTPHWQLESWLRYQLLEDGVLEMTLECIPHARTFKNGYIGLFFASYIDQPESLDIHFIGRPAEENDQRPRWVQGVTPAHGELSTHLALDDNRSFAHDTDFPLTLVFNKSNYRYSEPWYYGLSHGMAFVLMFRPCDHVRLSQSPSGGGNGNPAWDFQWFVPQYEVGQRYRFVMRAMYLPFESREQIIQATAPHRAALGQSQLPVTEPRTAVGPGKAVPEGFIPLFNGINLDGWKVLQSENHDWQVVDGVIDCDPHEGRGDKNLWTIKNYGDFELLVDWRIKESPYINRAAKIILPDGTYKKDDSGKEVLIEVPNTDSGIFLRGQHKSQVNIWCWPVGSGEVWGYRTAPAFSPEVHAGVTPKVKADRPIGEWNTFHIVMRGDRLTVTLNGKLVLDNAQLPGVPAQGPIALQHHGDRKDGEWGASFLQFRNIFIKELRSPSSQ